MGLSKIGAAGLLAATGITVSSTVFSVAFDEDGSAARPPGAEDVDVNSGGSGLGS